LARPDLEQIADRASHLTRLGSAFRSTGLKDQFSRCAVLFEMLDWRQRSGRDLSIERDAAMAVLTIVWPELDVFRSADTLPVT
jgi:hypothetical protein